MSAELEALKSKVQKYDQESKTLRDKFSGLAGSKLEQGNRD